MQEINWDIFKAKFNDRQEKFEWLCSVLFAKEFNDGKGLFKYKNQTGIESELLQFNNEWIGFQAKFYETKLAVNQNEFKDSIDKAKKKNPQLTQILFYTNQSLTESSSTETKRSQFEVDIEQYAKSKGVQVIWRTHGWFETDDICQNQQSDYILKYFFSNEKSIIELDNELSNHTENILQNIHSCISWNDQIIQINRQSTLDEIKQKTNSAELFIVHGEAGAGKTALIKDLYDSFKESSKFYLFKATEFSDLKHENEIFKHYHDFSLSEFVKVYEEEPAKYFVIDSAEKFTDLDERSTSVLQSFLQELIKSGWKVILTTRNHYLADLKNIVVDSLELRFTSIDIPNLLTEQLEEIANQYNFKVPINKLLKTLLRNPFYLNEYLQSYEDSNQYFDLEKFKDTLWRKRIANASTLSSDTEKCFLQIARDRANTGGFIIQSEFDLKVLQWLVNSEIIQYHKDRQGYSISHDIYEEWALERIVDVAFLNLSSYKEFFNKIGQSLPIRRSFRNWLLEKLASDIENVKSFIRESIISKEIEQFWKDEILVSVLLSDYSESFFEIFEKEILEDYSFRSRIILLLQTACKEIDETLLNSLGIGHLDSTMKTNFMKPCGKGWDCFIDFVHKKQNQMIFHLDEIIQMLNEWNSKNKSGETTKKASKIALNYFVQLSNEDSQFGYSSRNERRENLIRIILNGASEIKESLKSIFDLIIKEEIERGDSFYQIAKTILVSPNESIEVIKVLPEEVLKLADLFWNVPEKERSNELAYGGHLMDYWEVIFGITTNYDLKYFPSSSFQTPIYYLLHYHPQITIDFIISFVNKTVEAYTKSNSLDEEIPEIDVVNDNETQKQFISSRLWCSYRGTTVSPDLFQSIHMALEKWLLYLAKSYPKNTIESWCLYLLRKSKSSSISAVIASIAIAYPEKLFDIAKILFQTKEFFFCDTSRLASESNALAPLGAGEWDYLTQRERMESNKLKHRQASLESLALQYQFDLGKESENDIEKRQQTIWEIFDRYYVKLPSIEIQTVEDKTWRLSLARMDLRKMTPELVEQSNQRFIQFKPSLESDIEIISQKAQEELKIMNEISALSWWSRFRFEGRQDKYEQYLHYESNPSLVIEETKKIIEKLGDTSDQFNLLKQHIPSYSCTVLIRDFADLLNDQEKNFCKDIIFQYANSLFEENHEYQIADGVEAAINAFPYLLKYFPEEKYKIKSILLLTLFNEYPLGFDKRICYYSIEAIINNKLWESSPEDANSIFLGYLSLVHKYNNLINPIRRELIQKGVYKFSFSLTIQRFKELYGSDLNMILDNQISFAQLTDLKGVRLTYLCTALNMLPVRLIDTNQAQFMQIICSLFAKNLFNKDSKRDTERMDYMLKHRFLDKFSAIVLNSPSDKCIEYIRPFLKNFSNCDNVAEFFKQFILAQDNFNQYEKFWFIWESFYNKIVDICSENNKRSYYSQNIIHSYLFAIDIWNKDIQEWHSLTDRQISFFEKVSKDMGHHPAVIYSLSTILNGVASKFQKEGISWISHILNNHSQHLSSNLETNTIFYLENLVRNFIFNNRDEIKTNRQIKNRLVTVLTMIRKRGQ
ncbi:MAG: AVAST type 4 anti-phage nuclease Avs4, partial [Candidatus Melainabacteria bacterium]